VRSKEPPPKKKKKREKTKEKRERERGFWMPISACFFWFKFGVEGGWGLGFGDHTQEGLAKFGYRSESKLKF
jgi:hypothetical protein